MSLLGANSQADLPWKQAATTAEMRAEMNERGLATLDDEELKTMSAKFNELLEFLVPGTDRARSWVTLFKNMDDDDSGLIRYDELADKVYVEAKQSKADFPEATLKRLWCTLDKDDSDTLAREEFGKFMKIAGPDTGTHAGQGDVRAEEVRKQHLEEEAKRKAELAKIVGDCKVVTAELRAELTEKGLSPLNEEEMAAMSTIFNARVGNVKTLAGRGWLALFNAADDDLSGMIMYDELVDVMRVELCMSKEEVPESMCKQLWCALDKDDSNTCGRDEFGKFMMIAGPERTVIGAHERRVEEVRQQALAKVAEKEAYEAKLTGANVKTSEMRVQLAAKGLAPMNEDELTAMSKTFNERLAEVKTLAGKGWLALFRQADDDRSGLIMYDELVDVARVELKLTKAEAPEMTMKQLWCALDKDDSNTCQSDEFGSFMALGAPERQTVGAQDRRAEAIREEKLAKEAADKAARAKLISENKMDTVKLREKLKSKGVAPMSEEEEKKESLLFNERLQKYFIGKKWVHLFNMADDDASGMIMHDELLDVMRVELKLTPEEYPESRLEQLWVVLDKDDSNTIQREEFGRFMMLGAPERSTMGSHQRRVEEKREMLRAQRTVEEADRGLIKGEINVHTAEVKAELRKHGLEPSSTDELHAMSKKLNDRLDYVNRGKKSRSWIEVFKAVDVDGSGMITYEELQGVIRRQLHLEVEELPESNIKQLWCALDADDSNHLAQAEFGKFMMMAAPKRETLGAMDRRAMEVKKAKAEKVAAQEAVAMQINGMNVVTTAQITAELSELGVPPASDEEQELLSIKFNQRLMYMLPGKERARSWLTLFKEIDVDDSGLITYDELADAVRVRLKLSKSDLPDVRLKALWLALDNDGGGQIASSEFGRFMKMQERAMKAGTPPKRQAVDFSAFTSRKATPLDPRFAPGANRPTGRYFEALLKNRGANPGPPKPGPSYDESPWKAKNQAGSFHFRSPGARAVALDLLSKPNGPLMRSIAGSSHPSRPNSPPKDIYIAGAINMSTVSYSSQNTFSPDGRWPAPPRPQTSVPSSVPRSPLNARRLKSR